MASKPKKGQLSESGGKSPLETLKSVYDFMTKNSLEAIEIASDGALVKLVRRRSLPAPMPAAPSTVEIASRAAPLAAIHVLPPQNLHPLPAGTSVKSPMMGIFYRAPTPSSPPFCKEGDGVKPGQVLCMIEAMKVFNEIKAEFPCTIVKCLVENGKPVKAGQDLLIISR